jgi:hypothetical protein
VRHSGMEFLGKITPFRGQVYDESLRQLCARARC